MRRWCSRPETASPDKTFHAVPNAHHNDSTFVAGQDYWKWVGEFVMKTEKAYAEKQ